MTDGQPPHALPIPKPVTAGGLASEGRRGVSVCQSSPKVPAPQSGPGPLAGDEGGGLRLAASGGAGRAAARSRSAAIIQIYADGVACILRAIIKIET